MLKDQTHRYHDVEKSVVPGQLPPEARINRNIAIRHASVADPNPALRGKRQRVAVNRLSDALEQEASRGRISGEAYWAGRCFQEFHERNRTPSSGAWQWNPTGRSCEPVSHDHSMIKKVLAARDIVDLMKEIMPVIGMLGERVLTLVLLEGLTIHQVAERFNGKEPGTDKVFFWGETFRQSLQALADHWCGPKEKHARSSNRLSGGMR